MIRCLNQFEILCAKIGKKLSETGAKIQIHVFNFNIEKKTQKSHQFNRSLFQSFYSFSITARFSIFNNRVFHCLQKLSHFWHETERLSFAIFLGYFTEPYKTFDVSLLFQNKLIFRDFLEAINFKKTWYFLCKIKGQNLA